jgi:hypothetical protein
VLDTIAVFEVIVASIDTRAPAADGGRARSVA